MKTLRMAVRTLRKTPFVTAVAILSLALGIGANAAIFSLFDQLLLQRLPVQEPERLVNFAVPGPQPGSNSCGSAGGCDEVLSYPMLRDLIDHESSTMSGVAGHVLFGVNLSFDGTTTNGTGLQVTGSYFPVLGARPALGRLLGPDDDRDIGGHYVTVLSHEYWANDLGADPTVLNRTLIINGEPMTVVGVAQAGFTGTTLGASPDVFVPMTMRSVMLPWFDGFENRRWYWAYAFGRLAPGVSIEEAHAEMNARYSSLIRDVEAPLQSAMSESTMERFLAKELVMAPGHRGQSTLHGEVTTPLRLLFLITGMVLLIACANIANLLLARGAARAQEMAIRGAMGASRRQLLTQLLVESLVLAAAGGVASLVVADWTLGLLPSILPPDALETITVALSPGVVAFAALVSIGTGFLFGMYPALHATRTDLIVGLKSSGQPSGARAAARFRSGLVTAQIALSMTLLVGAGLFVRSLMNVSAIDLGLNPTNVVTFSLSPTLNGYTPLEARNLFIRIEERLAGLPGATAVTASRVPVLAGNSWGNSVSVEGFEWTPDVNANSRYSQVGPGYYSALQIPLLAGREFTPSDVEGAAKVAVINEAFAERFGLDPRTAVGKFMATRSGNDVELDTEIVGVVENARYSAVKDEVPAVYTLPYRQADDLTSMHFYVRTGLDPSEIMRAINPVVRELDANLPVEDIKTLEGQIDENIVIDRLISTLSAAFAILATLLAAVGLYGVLTYTVAQRTREIGLRMALGAGGGRVRAMILAQVTRMTIVGGILGIVAALALGRWAESLLFGLDGSDPVVVVLVAATIGAVSFLAGYLPARRASRVDPMVALRYE